jgi:hypothetical protein
MPSVYILLAKDHSKEREREAAIRPAEALAKPAQA